jgi:hypothetical protein
MKTKYTPTLMRKICQGLASGRSLESVCAELSVDPQAVHRWRRSKSSPTAESEYQTARQDAAWTFADKALDYVDEIQSLKDDMRVGSLPAPEGKAMIRGCETQYRMMTWLAGKMSPSQFGDRQQVELSGQVGVKPLPATPQDVMREFVELLQLDVEFVSQSILSAGEDYARTVRDRLASALGPGASGPHEGASHAAVPHVS